MEYSIFSKNLKFYRKNLGLTQKELGIISELGQVSIANYEAGRRFPNEKTLKILANALNIKVNIFFIDTDILLAPNLNLVFSIDKFIYLLLKETIDNCFLYVSSWKESFKFTVQETYNNILIETLKEVGNKWENNSLLITEEHVISEKIRSLIILISNKELSLKRSPIKNNLIWLGFVAPGEQHDMVLLMLSQVARLRGWEVYFIGKDIPVEDLINAIKRYKPTLIFASIIMNKFQESLNLYLKDINKQINKKPMIYVGGRGCNSDFKDSTNCIDGVIKTFNQGCELFIKVEEKL